MARAPTRQASKYAPRASRVALPGQPRPCFVAALDTSRPSGHAEAREDGRESSAGDPHPSGPHHSRPSRTATPERNSEEVERPRDMIELMCVSPASTQIMNGAARVRAPPGSSHAEPDLGAARHAQSIGGNDDAACPVRDGEGRAISGFACSTPSGKVQIHTDPRTHRAVPESHRDAVFHGVSSMNPRSRSSTPTPSSRRFQNGTHTTNDVAVGAGVVAPPLTC